jgi:hypothetical protein
MIPKVPVSKGAEGNIEIMGVVSCDSSGNSKDTFKRGQDAYFKVIILNTCLEPRTPLITINTYDSHGIVVGLVFGWVTIYPGTTTLIFCMNIPRGASSGVATVYVNAFTNFPHYGGLPYCPEMALSFQIAYPPQPFLKCDGVVDGKDLVLFMQCYKGLAPSEAMYLADLGGGGLPPQFLKYDGKVDGRDLVLFMQCYRGLAPSEVMYLGDLGGN